jgi:hypothetical protein
MFHLRSFGRNLEIRGLTDKIMHRRELPGYQKINK